MGVTISLSSPNKHTENNELKKVITLKDFSEFGQNNGDKQPESYPSDIESEILKRQDELRLLDAKKQNKLQEIQDSIEKEKEAWLVTKEEEREEAQSIGYETGYNDGIELAQQEYQTALARINDITATAQEEYFETIAKHEYAIIELAIITAEKITKQSLRESVTGMTTMVKDAIKDLQKRSNISLYVTPDDYQHVVSRKEELEELLQDGEVIAIYIDDKMNEGDCLIKHPYGQLNISVDVQLKQIKSALVEKIKESQSS